MILFVILIVAILAGGLFAVSSKPKVEKAKTAIFIDVRTDEEWESGHLNGATHFDLARLQKGELPDVSKDSEILVYCRSGKRAGEAEQILLKNDFKHVSNAGGFSDIQTQGEKVCFGTSPDCS